jgi:hypothetical protein
VQSCSDWARLCWGDLNNAQVGGFSRNKKLAKPWPTETSTMPSYLVTW